MTMEERYQRLEDTVRAYNPTASFDKIRAAYEFAAAAHQGQLRKDGSPFVTHPLAVAQIVAAPPPSRAMMNHRAATPATKAMAAKMKIYTRALPMSEEMT